MSQYTLNGGKLTTVIQYVPDVVLPQCLRIVSHVIPALVDELPSPPNLCTRESNGHNCEPAPSHVVDEAYPGF
jgi:hypothetical protein